MDKIFDILYRLYRVKALNPKCSKRVKPAGKEKKNIFCLKLN